MGTHTRKPHKVSLPQEAGWGPEVGGRHTSFSNCKIFTMDMHSLTICLSLESHALHVPASTPLLMLFPLPLTLSLPPPAVKCPEKLSLVPKANYPPLPLCSLHSVPLVSYSTPTGVSFVSSPSPGGPHVQPNLDHLCTHTHTQNGIMQVLSRCSVIWGTNPEKYTLG